MSSRSCASVKRRRLLTTSIGHWLTMLFFLTVVHFAQSHQPPKKELPEKGAVPVADPAKEGPKLKQLTVDQLIDRLQEVEDGGEQIGPKQMVKNQFIIEDLEPFYQQKNHGELPPKISPIIKELVRRGMQSLPKLLDHLDDKRSTKLVALPLFFRKEEDPRRTGVIAQAGNSRDMLLNFVAHTEAAVNPNGFEKNRHDFWRYEVKVGDLCYVIVGQIVNRNLRLVLEQDPTVRLNSPVHMPEVASACRKEWAGLTIEKHKESLIKDCLDQCRREDRASSMIRLHFYYPKEGEMIIVDHLRRTIAKENVSFEFCSKTLLSISDNEYDDTRAVFDMAEKTHKIVKDAILWSWWWGWSDDEVVFGLVKANNIWRAIVNDLLFIRYISVVHGRKLEKELNWFKNKYGDKTALEIPMDLVYSCLKYDSHLNGHQSSAIRAYKAKTILMNNFKNLDESRYRMISEPSAWEMDELISDLPEFPSVKVDQAVFSVFQQMSADNNRNKELEPFLARECLDRLIGKGYDVEFRVYLERQIEMAENDPDLRTKDRFLKRDRDALARLKK